MEGHEQSLVGRLVTAVTGLHLPDHLVMATFVVVIWTVLLLAVRPLLRSDRPGTIQIFLEGVLGFLRGLLRDVIGPHGLRFLPVIGLFAVFIFTSNACGLVPGLLPPTDNLNVTLALALVSFLYYNAIGIREHGILRYLRHFAGPDMGHWAATVLIGLLLFPVEIISHFARIISLSVRLFGNMFGEHLSSGVFSTLVPIHPGSWKLVFEIPASIVVPWPVMLLGIIAVTLQTFIFVMLSTVYLAMATEHEEEEGHAHPEPHAGG